MCELLGMSFNVPVTPEISFNVFRKRSKDNPHGWGIAYYPDESAQIIKEELKAEASKLSQFLPYYQNLKSQIFVAHVRYSSIGKVSHKNTHPFSRELNGKEYVFAHNGTLKNYRDLKLGRFKPIGETDSEYAFCYILNFIESKRITTWSKTEFDLIADVFMLLNSKGEFNCLLSDGNLLFAYYDKEGYNGLKFIQRKPPYSTIKLKDNYFEINLAEAKNEDQKGYIIATRELTNEEWDSFKPGQLLVFRYGEIIYSNKS